MLVAQGGMGQVYRATDSALERTVAVKLLSDRYAGDEEARVRFRREALAAARLSTTPNVVTVFADGEVDRSPCGSGTSARLALLDRSGQLRRGESLLHRSIVDTEFRGRVVDDTEVAGIPAVVTEVEGSAYRTGEHVFTLDPADPLPDGFLLR